MNYFIGITDLDEAKLHYRKLAKQLHPDAEGTTIEFQKLQEEYKAVLLQIQQNRNADTNPLQTASAENELLNELGKLAKVLISKQVPQNYLRHKMQMTDSSLKKGLFRDIVEFLDKIS